MVWSRSQGVPEGFGAVGETSGLIILLGGHLLIRSTLVGGLYWFGGSTPIS